MDDSHLLLQLSFDPPCVVLSLLVYHVVSFSFWYTTWCTFSFGLPCDALSLLAYHLVSLSSKTSQLNVCKKIKHPFLQHSKRYLVRFSVFSIMFSASSRTRQSHNRFSVCASEYCINSNSHQTLMIQWGCHFWNYNNPNVKRVNVALGTNSVVNELSRTWTLKTPPYFKTGRVNRHN